MNRRAEAVTIILVLIIIIAAIVWLVSLGGRECSKNEDCKAQQYCGSDFSCHDFPVIEKTVYEVSLVGPALIVAAAIVLGAGILRWRKNRKPQMPKEGFY